MRQRAGIAPRDERRIMHADMVRHMEGAIRGANGRGPRGPTGVEDRGASARQDRELGRSKGLLQCGGRAAQSARREEARWPLGSRMPPYERGHGQTPAEQRGAHGVKDSMATPATRRGGATATTGVEFIARRARREPGARFSALMHHFWQAIARKLHGHFNYVSMTDNSPALWRSDYAVRRLLFIWVNAAASAAVSHGRASAGTKPGISSHAQAHWSHPILFGERSHEEACGGKPPAGFGEGETSNGARSTIVTLLTPYGGSNREHRADLSIGAVLPTRPETPEPIFTLSEFERRGRIAKRDEPSNRWVTAVHDPSLVPAAYTPSVGASPCRDPPARPGRGQCRMSDAYP
jgi:hypothetical protein